MKTFFLFLAIISTTLCYAGSSVTIPADNKLIEYTGRIDFSNAKAPRFSYSGVSIRACFNGTSLSAIMDDNVGKNFYNIIIDGEVLDTINVSVGKKVYKLAEGLKNTNHEIEIFKRTEEQFGKTQFLGFILDEGASLTKMSFQKDKLIEYIGNSITCGYGNEGHNGETFGPTTENHYLTYAAITSRFFGARHLAVCKSGIGVYRNYNGPATGSADCMANIYTRVFLKDKNPEYSFSQKPDLVCIDLGTNDFSTPGGDSARFVSAYLRLIDTIQTKNEKADIICLLGPMLSDPILSNVRGYIKNVVKLANQKGNGNVYFFEMSQQTGNLGIDGHPTVAQHVRNAKELTDYIVKLKGWQSVVRVGYAKQKKLPWTN
jgi:lysophospholipase L1-like esterase